MDKKTIEQKLGATGSFLVNFHRLAEEKGNEDTFVKLDSNILMEHLGSLDSARRYIGDDENLKRKFLHAAAGAITALNEIRNPAYYKSFYTVDGWRNSFSELPEIRRWSYGLLRTFLSIIN